jgi:hypothetical protein
VAMVQPAAIGSRAAPRSYSSEGPLPPPRDWRRKLQLPQREGELAALRQSLVQGAPPGETSWQRRTRQAIAVGTDSPRARTPEEGLARGDLRLPPLFPPRPPFPPFFPSDLFCPFQSMLAKWLAVSQRTPSPLQNGVQQLADGNATST